MRILQVIPTLKRAGAEVFLKNLVSVMKKNNIDVTILFFSSADPVLLGQLNALGIQLIQLSENCSPYSLFNFFKLYRFLKNNKFDLIHAHLTPAQFFLSIINIFYLFKLPLITTEHSVNNKRRKLRFKFFDWFLYKSYKKIICVSPPVRDSLVGWLPNLSKKCEIIYNGVFLDEFNCKSDFFNQKRFIVICVGRLIALKNQAVCIKAIAKLTNFELWLVGDGELRDSLRKLSHDLGVDQRVKFLGDSDNVAELLSQADIYVHPSLWEGFSIALVEAMATGMPIIASDIPSLREASKDCARYFAPKEYLQLADLLELLADNPDLRESMGKKAHERAQKFSIENSFLEHMKLYRALINH